jgi:hypothetical protein
MQLAIKEAAVKLSLVLPHVLRLQLAKRKYTRVEMEPHWISPPGRVRDGVMHHTPHYTRRQ